MPSAVIDWLEGRCSVLYCNYNIALVYRVDLLTIYLKEKKYLKNGFPAFVIQLDYLDIIPLITKVFVKITNKHPKHFCI